MNNLARMIFNALNSNRGKNFIGKAIQLYRDSFIKSGHSVEYAPPENLIGNIITLKTEDDITISSTMYEVNPESKKWIIAMHGFASNSDDIVWSTWFWTALGYNLAVFDFRGHGRSQDALTTFGINEKKDLKTVIKYVFQTYHPDSIGISGASMGAFTANYFALTEPEFIKKHNVQFGVSDATYDSIPNLLFDLGYLNWPQLGDLLKTAMQDVIKIYQDQHGINLHVGEAELLLENATTTIPMLYFHGKKDTVTKVASSELFYKKRKNITGAHDMIELFDDATHVQSFHSDEKKYLAAIIKFLKEIL